MAFILVVDDEFGMAETLRDLLRDEGYKAEAVFSGQQAMERMALERPRLVLTDYMMPAMNGPELVEAMRAHPTLADVPVVMMSSAPPHFWSHLPCAALLPKPFRLKPLLEVVRRLIGPAPGI